MMITAGPVLRAIVLVSAVASPAASVLGGPAPPIEWQAVIPGVSYAAIPIRRAVAIGDTILRVVRIDPRRAPLVARMAARDGGGPRTANEWCTASSLAVAINLGMFQGGGLANVGYARNGLEVSNGRWASGYK